MSPDRGIWPAVAPDNAVDKRPRIFRLFLIKPSHYDDDGYVIQWVRSNIPSNSLAALNGIARKCVDGRVLGNGVKIEIAIEDEINTRIRPERVARAIQASSTPICGVGVLPIIAGLLGAGVPLAPVMAFWLASPVTDPGMLAITAGTLGLPFAAGKTVFACLIGIAGGAATAVLVRAGAFRAPLKGPDHAACKSATGERGLMLLFWREPDRRALFRRDAQDAAALILKWLTVAFLLEGLLRQHLPAGLVAQVVGGSNEWAIPLAVALGAPIYLDGYAALPLVRGLMDMGMTPGAAMAFLIAGGVTSLYASIAVFALVRPAVFAWYLALAVVLALAAGYGWELIAPLARA